MLKKHLINAVVAGLAWWFTYLYIRRYMNPEHDNIEKFKNDALYGAIAAFVMTISKGVVTDYLIKKKIL
jgi:hypothetical protein